MSQRTQRLDELLRQEIGAMLEREVADPRIGFATVTQVETAPDLRHAKVWVSVIGGAAARAETVTALEHAMVFVRRELGTRLRLKRIPDLHVRLDDSIERGTRVLRLIDSLETGDLPGDAVEGESLPTPTRGVASPEAAVPDPSGGPAQPQTLSGGSPPLPPSPSPAADGFGAAAAEYAARIEAGRRTSRSGRTGGAPRGSAGRVAGASHEGQSKRPRTGERGDRPPRSRG